MTENEALASSVVDFLDRVQRRHDAYRRGEVHARVPAILREPDRPLEELVALGLPASHAALTAAARNLFYSLPVAFDPDESIGPYLATADRDPATGEPYRFLDMGALIATHAFGENDPAVVAAVLRELPCAVSRFAHSEYQTVLSLRAKAALDAIAPRGTPRHFVVNTGSEAVENAIKAVLLHRVLGDGEPGGGFIVSFEGAFHGRTLGSLAATHRRRARLGFPTFDWPHALFPSVDPRSPHATALLEERSLLQVHDLIAHGPLARPGVGVRAFGERLCAIDAFLEARSRRPSEPDAPRVAAFVESERARVPREALEHARRAAAVLVEPIQGEGGVRLATPRFFQRLRLLTRILGVPLVFDEVQTGWGATGRLWAHEHFDLPAPPDAVVWAKKAQNGVLFVSEELATFFQEEKKFNTTWEGDSVGMARLLAMLPRLDLEQVNRTGAIARAGLERLDREFPELLRGVRGQGVMLAFDVARPDWRDELRDRAFRLGLILLPAGERALRFYPRYDTEPRAIEEALGILRQATQDIVEGRATTSAALGPEVRVGALECPLSSLEPLSLTAESFPALAGEVMAVEVERYGALSQYPKDVLKAGRRPLLQYPAATLEATASHPRSVGVALRDRVSGKLVAYALASPLELHDEEGVRDDPRHGENDTLFLQAMATLPSVRNRHELENQLLEIVRQGARARGLSALSTLLEASVLETGPPWLRAARVLRRVEDYLGSGIAFVYLSCPT